MQIIMAEGPPQIPIYAQCHVNRSQLAHLQNRLNILNNGSAASDIHKVIIVGSTSQHTNQIIVAVEVGGKHRQLFARARRIPTMHNNSPVHS